MPDNYEANTNLREIALRIIAHKKLLLICTLIITLIFTVRAARHVKVTSNYEEGKSMISEEEYAEKLERYNLMLDKYSTMISDVESQLEVKNDYINNSILMSIDPYREVRATFQVQIVSGNGAAITDQNVRNSLTNYYNQFIVNGSGWTDVSEELGIKEGYLREACATAPDTNTCIINVTLKHKDEENADKVASMIKERILEYYDSTSANQTAHMISIQNENLSSVLDNDLITTQTNKKNEVNSLKQNIINYNNNINNLSKPDEEKVIHETSEPATKKDIVKGFIEGIIFGLIITVMGISLYLIYGDFVLSSAEIERKFKIFAFPASKSMDMFSYKIGTFYPDFRKYVLIGKRNEKNAARFDEIVGSLSKNYEIKTISGDRENLDECRVLTEADAVIILSETEKTRYREIKNVIAMASDWKKKVAGIINI
ncbi:hypothetical protein QYZ88_010935 [Lachnospiraceae bacterium C1.1]|nr:hypothetical protein [Lachnospiraceae bacterium C1.1]